MYILIQRQKDIKCLRHREILITEHVINMEVELNERRVSKEEVKKVHDHLTKDDN